VLEKPRKFTRNIRGVEKLRQDFWGAGADWSRKLLRGGGQKMPLLPVAKPN
jgi:hypothetical protein